MEFVVATTIKQNEKSVVQLVKKKDDDTLYIRKILTGRKEIYRQLQTISHQYLPKIYEATLSEDKTTVIEQYVQGPTLGQAGLREDQLVTAMKELCDVLTVLHGKGILHRDIKPSNILYAQDGHIRLIDFDAARTVKDDQSQDTRLLGTRGYAAPEQYGFSQTDERTDIYALGVTFKLLLGAAADKPKYKHVIDKCTNLDPDKRYQTTEQVKRALLGRRSIWPLLSVMCACLVVLFVALSTIGRQTTLTAPAEVKWDGDTSIATWKNVPESGTDGEIGYLFKLYRMDTATLPDPSTDEPCFETSMRGNGMVDENGTCSFILSPALEGNGYYYFAVAAVGDGSTYKDSDFSLSDAFAFTGEDATPLPKPTDLEWKRVETSRGRFFYATWNNLDDYANKDVFNVTVYDKDGNYVMNNMWSKKVVEDRGYHGIGIQGEYMSDKDGKYRFTVDVYSARPNDYAGVTTSFSTDESDYSPWYYQ